jgi:hypothetical protein
MSESMIVTRIRDLGAVAVATPDDPLLAVAYVEALHGRVPAPDYRVAAGPAGEFVAVLRPGVPLRDMAWALVAGNCVRRLAVGTSRGVFAASWADPFVEVRHGTWSGRWPEESQRPMFPCPVCGMISAHPEDARHGYCGACHAVTHPAEVGSGLVLRAVESEEVSS